MQTGKTNLMPLVYLDPDGDPYWDEWDDYVDRQLVKRGMVSPEDACFPDSLTDMRM